MTLNEVKLNVTKNIERINCIPEIKKRFIDLGFIKGSKITPILTSPSKNIRAYLIKDTVIAVRDIDSQNIIVK